MPKFSYSVLEADGRKRKGSVLATDLTAAQAELSRSGFRVIDLKPARHKRLTKLERASDYGSICLSEFALELSGLLRAGAPLRKALEIQSSGQNRTSELARTLRRSIDSGKSFSESLRAVGGKATFLAEFARIGESGGRLEPMLEQANSALAARDQVVKRVRSALAYPIFILCLAVFAIGVITLYVAPALEPTLRDSNPDSVLLIFADVGNTLQTHQQTILLSLATVITVAYLLSRSKMAKRKLTRSLMSLPIIGKVAQDLEAGQAGIVIAALLGAGRPFDDALRYAAKVSNEILGREFILMAQGLRDGQPFAVAIQNARYLPNEIKRLAILGEKSSALPEAIEQASDLCTKRAMRKIDQFSSAVGPMLVIGLGASISLLLISVLGSLSGLGDTLP